MPKITKEFLLEIGGWRAMQEGRSLYESGKVLSWKWEPPLLKGVVQAGTSTVNARLKMGKRLSDVENLCSCRQAREYGTICSHVIALGLAAMNDQSAAPGDNGKAASSPGQNGASVSKSKPSGLKRVPIVDAGQEDVRLLELSILLPVDLPVSWEKKQMRIILEGSLDGAEPAPLDSFKRDASAVYSMFECDLRLLSAIEKICGGEVPGMWVLSKEWYTAFFEILLGHPRVSLGKKSSLELHWSKETCELLIDAQASGDIFLKLDQKQHLEGQRLDAPGSSWLLTEGSLELLGMLPSAYKLLRQRDVVLPRSAVGHFFQTELPQLERQVQVCLGDQARKIRFSRQKPQIHVRLDGTLAGLNCRIEASYGSSVHSLKGYPNQSLHSHDAWTPDPDDPFRYFVRDRDTEKAVQREVIRCGFQPGQRNAEVYTLATENKVGAFLANTLAKWQANWKVSFSERTDNFISKCDFVKPHIDISTSGEDWLSLEVEFREASGKLELTQAEVQDFLRKGVSHHRRSDGRIVLLPTDSVEQFNAVLYDCHVQAGESGWKMDKRYASYLHGVLRNGDWDINSRTEWKLTDELRSYEEVPLNESLTATLREYQHKGVNWLQYLFQNRFGGILADEMGLGKTIQTLAYLSFRKKQALSSRPVLIVGPTSLVRNWMDEAARFTPELSVMALQGAGRRELFKEIDKYDIVITSYSLLRRDIPELQKLEFDTVVLDEAQNIKNRASQNAQSAKALRADHHLVLTGTPVENSLFDLWSIFDFLMPGYLGKATEFRDRYESPISKLSDEKAMERLRQRIRPFVLRRTKQEVAKDLPPKIEHLAYCDLTEEQKAVYQSILEQGRREVFQLSGTNNKGRDRLAVLTALTRLRQVCCHLELLPAAVQKDWKEPSAKMDYFFELLDEAIDGGHRILVFSQFVSLLKILRSKMQKHKIEHCYLDGATTERHKEVERFQNTSDIPVFLISLKAGGTGLNLTGADTVIHLDPWWNPTVEDQATARAHRMGQSRLVTSYKLIARGTVEEKIIRLQEKKKVLISNTVVSEEAFIHNLSWEELQGLLE